MEVRLLIIYVTLPDFQMLLVAVRFLFVIFLEIITKYCPRPHRRLIEYLCQQKYMLTNIKTIYKTTFYITTVFSLYIIKLLLTLG